MEEDLLLDNGGIVRLIRVRRPKVLNALNTATYEQLQASLTDIANSPHVVGAVLSGFGAKAFIAGADVNALHKVHTPEEGYAIAKLAQDVARQLETLGKPVVAALNGVAFGGGLELALGCTARIGVLGRGPLCGLPEVNLGIIPAGGGTQRFTRLVGWERAHELIRRGRALTATEALAHGVISHIGAADRLISTAVAMVAHLSAGKMEVPAIPEGVVLETAPTLPDVKLGHLSTAVDALISESIAQGLTMTLEDGLALELDVFKRICLLDDMRIGVDNFVSKGPRSKAAFTHK